MRKKERIPGAPAGNTFTPKQLNARVTRFDCYEGQAVRLGREFNRGAKPDKVTVVHQYDQHILLLVETGSYSHKISVNKASLLCGDEILTDATTGRPIRPVIERTRRSSRGWRLLSDDDSLV